MLRSPVARGDEVKPAATPSVKFTPDDFLHYPDDGRRHEIIDGEHYVTPSPNTKHQAVFVGEYWVVDPDLDTMKIDRRVESNFIRATELSVEAGDTLLTPFLPGFAAPLTEVFVQPLQTGSDQGLREVAVVSAASRQPAPFRRCAVA